MKKVLLFILLIIFSCISCVFCACIDEPNNTKSEDKTPSNTERTDETTVVVEDEITVTFKQNGAADVVKVVKKGSTLTDIPTPATKIGYTIVWNRTDFTNITENIEVGVIETAKTYTITLDANGGTVTQSTVTVTYDQAYQLEVPVFAGKEFTGWTYNDISEVATQGTWKIDAKSGTLVLVANWEDITGNTHFH